MPRRPSSTAALSPAGPPPMMSTGTRSSWMSRKSRAGSSAGAPGGSTGRPSTGSRRAPARTSSMHDFTGMPSASTRHWAHWPLAQKIPCGAASLRWWPKVRMPLANRAAAMVSPSRAVSGSPFQVKGTSGRGGMGRIGWCSSRCTAGESPSRFAPEVLDDRGRMTSPGPREGARALRPGAVPGAGRAGSVRPSAPPPHRATASLARTGAGPVCNPGAGFVAGPGGRGWLAGPGGRGWRGRFAPRRPPPGRGILAGRAARRRDVAFSRAAPPAAGTRHARGLRRAPLATGTWHSRGPRRPPPGRGVLAARAAVGALARGRGSP